RDPVRLHRGRGRGDGKPARGRTRRDPGGRGAVARVAGREALGRDHRAVRASDRAADGPFAAAERAGAAVIATDLRGRPRGWWKPLGVAALILGLAVGPPPIGGGSP